MVNGILNIYKEKGYTSHDVVARLRRIVGQKKIGHTGTLDPDAEGVLPVCLGRATKVCGMLTDKDKTYETVLLLGRITDTQDITGETIEERDISSVTEEAVISCIREFIGEYDQIPPMYSALKVNGKKLYELAREGKTVERKSRRVKIYDIRIKEVSLPRIRMEVDCSKGTYIRTLCSDIGEKLGCGGCMERLLRTKVERFALEDSRKLSEVERAVQDGRLCEILTPMDGMFSDLPKITVKKQYAALAYNGNPLSGKQVIAGEIRQPGEQATAGEAMQSGKQTASGGKADCTDGQVRVYDEAGRFIGIYRSSGRDRFRPVKMFLDPEELH